MVTWRAADTVAAQGFDECRELCSPQRGERQVGGEGVLLKRRQSGGMIQLVTCHAIHLRLQNIRSKNAF